MPSTRRIGLSPVIGIRLGARGCVATSIRATRISSQGTQLRTRCSTATFESAARPVAPAPSTRIGPPSVAAPRTPGSRPGLSASQVDGGFHLARPQEGACLAGLGLEPLDDLRSVLRLPVRRKFSVVFRWSQANARLPGSTATVGLRLAAGLPRYRDGAAA